MDSITLKAFAKINLSLNVKATRPDGYHELEGIMHSISTHDIVTVTKSMQNNIMVFCNEEIPYDNTARRAAELWMHESGITDGVIIEIEKNIPSQAGLGGASADAAAVLFALQELFIPLDAHRLFDIALAVGADVPFCLLGGAAIARGIGEVLTPIPCQQLHLLLVQDTEGISTQALFTRFDSHVPNTYPPDGFLEEMIAACKQHNTTKLCTNMYNALEAPACALVPEIERIKDRLIAAGALTAMMTGSGSVVFGVFSDMYSAKSALEKMTSFGYPFVQLAHTMPYGIETNAETRYNDII